MPKDEDVIKLGFRSSMDRGFDRALTDERVRAVELWMLRIFAGAWSLLWLTGQWIDTLANPDVAALWYNLLAVAAVGLAWAIPVLAVVYTTLWVRRRLQDDWQQ